MIVAVTLGIVSMLTAAMSAAALMIITRCCTGAEARRSINWQVLLVIGAALGIGRAVEMSGVAAYITDQLIGLAQGNPWLVLLAVYVVTALLTEMITNNAAAVLVFPIAIASAKSMGVDPMPFVITVMMAASASFVTPLGYQTNMMVYGPGGYRFTDFVRAGLPVSLTVMAITVGLAPLVWPFYP